MRLLASPWVQVIILSMGPLCAIERNTYHEMSSAQSLKYTIGLREEPPESWKITLNVWLWLAVEHFYCGYWTPVFFSRAPKYSGLMSNMFASRSHDATAWCKRARGGNVTPVGFFCDAIILRSSWLDRLRDQSVMRVQVVNIIIGTKRKVKALPNSSSAIVKKTENIMGV